MMRRLFLLSAASCASSMTLGDDGMPPGITMPNDESTGPKKPSKEKLDIFHSKVDSDSNLGLSHDEMIKFGAFHRNFINEKTYTDRFKKEDRDGDGKITLDEHLYHQNAPSDMPRDEKELKKRIAEMTADFKQADKNGDGTIDAEEARRLHYPVPFEDSHMGMAKEAVEHMDKNKDGKISVKEWTAEWTSNPTFTVHRKEEFELLDSNKDGGLEAAELLAYYSGEVQTHRSMAKLLKHKDADGDGHLSAEELATVWHELDQEHIPAKMQLESWIHHHGDEL
jgi:Ca2+-binding EF-hand superfamily protein